MRISINMPLKDADDNPLDSAGIMKRARMVEAAGLDGIWMGDGVGARLTRPDPLMWLLVAAAATEHIEVGTSILIVPVRHPVELAQRFLTLQALTRGRFTVGVGTGSGKATHAIFGLDWDDRYRKLEENLSIMKRLCNGETVGEANLLPWPSVKGGPPIVIGSWYSDIWLKRAAQEYDGWMASGGRTNFTTLREGIKRFRDLGGKRALISTVACDLSAPNSTMTDEESFNLRCGPEEAAERVARAADLGFDDLLLVKADHTRQAPLYEPDFTEEDLAGIRALIKKDDRKAYPDRK